MEGSGGLEVRHTSRVVWARMPDGSKAYVKYEVVGDRMRILETYTPPMYRGRGIARILMEHALRLAEDKGLLIEPVCSYAIRYFARNPDKKRLLAPEYRSIDLEELWKKRVEEERGRSKG